MPTGAILYFLAVPGGAEGSAYRGRLRADFLSRTIELFAGMDAEFAFRVVPVDAIPDALDADSLTFAGDEEIEAELWPGGTASATALPAEFVPEADPDDEDAEPAVRNLGLLRVPAGATDDLTPGVYRLRLAVVDPASGGRFHLAEVAAVVRGAPGSAEPAYGIAYCTAADVNALAPWSEDDAQDTAAAGWAGEIDRASRIFVDGTILARAKRAYRWGWYGHAARESTLDGWFDDHGHLAESAYAERVATALAAGRLATDATLAEATAHYALSLVRSRGMDMDARMAHRREAIQLLTGWTALVTIDADDESATEFPV